MRTKKILLLSCLYPLILFLVIGYTFSYSSKKAAQVAYQQKVNLLDIAFTSPIPATITNPTNALTPDEASRAAFVDVTSNNQDSQPTPTKESEPTISSAAATKISVQPTVQVTVIQESVTPTMTLSSAPTPELIQNTINAKSAKIIEDVSSAIVPNTSSVIIENDDPITP